MGVLFSFRASVLDNNNNTLMVFCDCRSASLPVTAMKILLVQTRASKVLEEDWVGPLHAYQEAMKAFSPQGAWSLLPKGCPRQRGSSPRI